MGGRTWGMEEDTPVMMVDMVSTVVIPAGENTHTHTQRETSHHNVYGEADAELTCSR